MLCYGMPVYSIVNNKEDHIAGDTPHTTALGIYTRAVPGSIQANTPNTRYKNMILV